MWDAYSDGVSFEPIDERGRGAGVEAQRCAQFCLPHRPARHEIADCLAFADGQSEAVRDSEPVLLAREYEFAQRSYRGFSLGDWFHDSPSQQIPRSTSNSTDE
jgi:hypothetical protein